MDHARPAALRKVRGNFLMRPSLPSFLIWSDHLGVQYTFSVGTWFCGWLSPLPRDSCLPCVSANGFITAPATTMQEKFSSPFLIEQLNQDIPSYDFYLNIL